MSRHFLLFRVEDTWFQENYASGSSGAVAVGPDVIITLRRSFFVANAAAVSVGAVGTSFNGWVRISDCVFNFNRALSEFGLVGAALLNFGNNVEITNSIFKGNEATLIGGALWLLPNSTFKITNCTFERNVARGAPAIALFANSTLDLRNSIFKENNSTLFNTGAIYTYTGATLTITSCSFVRNVALEKGAGAAILFGPANIVDIKDSIFLNNSAAQNGGAIFVSVGSSVAISGSVFGGNVAGNSGGAIAMVSANTSITNSIVSLCRSDLGGGISIQGGVTSFRNVSFLNNSAVSVAAVQVECALNQTDSEII